MALNAIVLLKQAQNLTINICNKLMYKTIQTLPTYTLIRYLTDFFKSQKKNTVPKTITVL